MTGWIGITLGDVTGIGLEVTLKALAAEGPADDTRYLLIGDAGHARRFNQQFSLNLPLQTFGGWKEPGRYFILNPLTESLPPDMIEGSPAAARAAVAWLDEAARRCLRHELDAMVTAPVNKASIVNAGHAFVGQTEFLSQLAGADRTVMMLLGQDDRSRWLRVALVTTHVPIKMVAQQITRAKVDLAIDLAAQSCRDLGLPRARIAVCGLNPHAGEGGQMGDEEQTIIGPAVLAAQRRRLDVLGPLSGDTVFHHALRGDYDAVVAMYHDQGLAPLKAVAFDTGVNWTLGLPFIRTSPDHGTAYDIAGQGIANPSSMIAALRLA
ncbi:MAG: 4-hydroxythreonine-4-phosphate dehydrogenase PdxA, partial [Verrucomicrobiota bacterium]